MKQLLDESVLGLFTARGELRHVACAGQTYLPAFIRRVLAHGVDEPFVFPGSEAAHGIKLLETEPERIDDRVTTLTSLRAGQFRHLLPHGQVRRKVGVLER